MDTSCRESMCQESTITPEYWEQLNLQDSAYDASAGWKRLCLCRQRELRDCAALHRFVCDGRPHCYRILPRMDHENLLLWQSHTAN